MTDIDLNECMNIDGGYVDCFSWIDDLFKNPYPLS